MKQDLIQMRERHVQCSGSGTGCGVVVAHVVDEEVAEVGEEVVVGEVIVVSSRAIALPKNLIAPLPYRGMLIPGIIR